MEKGKKTIGNIIRVTVSNFIKILASILVGFILPKIIGVSDYGYYKTFILYSGYCGLFHFGIQDGLYLLFGGKDYEQLEKSNFRFYSRFLIILEVVLALIVGGVSLSLLASEYRFIFACIGGYLIFYNIIGYYQMISQITGRFKEFSAINLIQSALTSIVIIGLVISYKFGNIDVTYRMYLLFYLFIHFAISIFYIIKYKDITFGKSIGFKEGKKLILESIKLGLPLLIGNLCISLFATIDRQFINIVFDNDTYAIYAFAYNLPTLINAIITAVSVVIYPTLKRSDDDLLKKYYSNFVSLMLGLVFFTLLAYFPLSLFIDWFLPKYHDSIVYIRLIAPGLALSGVILIVMQNYCKTLNYNKEFLIRSLICLLLTIGLIIGSYLIFNNIIYIPMVTILGLFIWYIVIDLFFIKKYKVNEIKNIIYLVVMMAGFYLITLINNYYIGCVAYFVFFAIISFALYYKEIKFLIKRKEQ